MKRHNSLFSFVFLVLLWVPAFAQEPKFDDEPSLRVDTSEDQDEASDPNPLSAGDSTLHSDSITLSTRRPSETPTSPSSLGLGPRTNTQSSSFSSSSFSPLSTSLKVLGVKENQHNQMFTAADEIETAAHERSTLHRIWEKLKFKNWDTFANRYSLPISCSQFRGTHAGNKVIFKAETTGGSGRYAHFLVYRFPSSFEGTEFKKQHQKKFNKDGTLTLALPHFKEDVSDVRLSVQLVTKDLETSRQKTAELSFRVTLPIILERSNDPEHLKKECFERMRPYLTPNGLRDNPTRNPVTLNLQESLTKTWAHTQGWQVGVFVSPLSFLTVGNLFFFNGSYFQQKTEKREEGNTSSTQYILDPGETILIHVQPTRYFTPYVASLVSACGQSQQAKGVYLYQSWGYSYIPYPVDPVTLKIKSSNPSLLEQPEENTCSSELTDTDEDGVPVPYQFFSFI